MNIKVHIDSMRDAEHFSNLLRKHPEEMTLNGGKFCVDPKSVLGVMAMMYSARDEMALNTGDMDDERIPALVREIGSYIKQ